MAKINGQDLFFFPTGNASGGSQEGSLYHHLITFTFGYSEGSYVTFSGCVTTGIVDDNQEPYSSLEALNGLRCSGNLACGHIYSTSEAHDSIKSIITSVDFTESGVKLHFCASAIHDGPISFIIQDQIDYSIANITDTVTKIPVDVIEVEGEGDENTNITVDQNYNPDSPNAQSGTAVAEAIESISGTELLTENLEFVYTTLYPNVTDYSFTTTSTPNGYWVYKAGNIKGGILSVNWDM